ncbi:hypothetical protein [Roseivivax sp. CAU 1761]
MATSTTGPWAGIRAVSAAGVSMAMPITASAWLQKAWPSAGPSRSKRRTNRSSRALPVLHSSARIATRFQGSGKVLA